MKKVKNLFDDYAGMYDPSRRIFIPCFTDLYSAIVQILELRRKTPVVVDIGAGTGIVSFGVRQKYPRAKIIMVDISEKMLLVAKEKFKKDKNIQYNVTDYFKMEGIIRVDAVVSGLSTHHFSDKQKPILYKNIYKALRSGGIFINADLVKGETKHLERLFERNWTEQMEKNGATKIQIKRRHHNQKIDKPALLDDNLNWLKEAGFRQVACCYRYYNFAVFFGIK